MCQQLCDDRIIIEMIMAFWNLVTRKCYTYLLCEPYSFLAFGTHHVLSRRYHRNVGFTYHLEPLESTGLWRLITHSHTTSCTVWPVLIYNIIILYSCIIITLTDLFRSHSIFMFQLSTNSSIRPIKYLYIMNFHF